MPLLSVAIGHGLLKADLTMFKDSLTLARDPQHRTWSEKDIPMNIQTGNKKNKTTWRASERWAAAGTPRSPTHRVVLFFLFTVWLFTAIPY